MSRLSKCWPNAFLEAMNGRPAKLVEATRCDCLPEAMRCDEKIGHKGMVASRGRRGPLYGY
jgi:hypothetical protein